MLAGNHEAVLGLISAKFLWEKFEGAREIFISILDGPVDATRWQQTTGDPASAGGEPNPERVNADHGTFICGILMGDRKSGSLGLCPDCTFNIVPALQPAHGGNNDVSMTTSPERLGEEITKAVDAGSHLINISLGLAPSANESLWQLSSALDYALSQGTVVVAAAGNQLSVGSSPLTRHPAVIPVAACKLSGSLWATSTLGASIGARGLRAPGAGIWSSNPGGGLTDNLTGTSVAAAVVTGALGLLWSEFPEVTGQDFRVAVHQAHSYRRSVTPPLLDVAAVYSILTTLRRDAVRTQPLT